MQRTLCERLPVLGFSGVLSPASMDSTSSIDDEFTMPSTRSTDSMGPGTSMSRNAASSSGGSDSATARSGENGAGHGFAASSSSEQVGAQQSGGSASATPSGWRQPLPLTPAAVADEEASTSAAEQTCAVPPMPRGNGDKCRFIFIRGIHLQASEMSMFDMGRVLADFWPTPFAADLTNPPGTLGRRP